ncbi:MAG: hypothetical protein JOZ27_08085, partial [Caulobacteraceae bacterium]|nr:hypothetical protein [Caulobacteraceae bacterium]
AAAAAPTLEIRDAAARVVILPESRRDIEVMVLKTAPRLPLKIRRLGERTFILGGLTHRFRGCAVAGGRARVRLWGREDVAVDDLPAMLVRVPLSVRVVAGEAVFGDVGRAHALDLTHKGCGVWRVANVSGHLHLTQTGAGTIVAGSAAGAEANVEGPGRVTVLQATGRVSAVSSGSGVVRFGAVRGPAEFRVAGAGQVIADGGSAPLLRADIAGSGTIRFAGVAGALAATVAGPGEVRVARVTGPVSRRVFGAGEVRVGDR